MKYINEIIIDLPVERVIELFDNPENMKYWQPGFISFEHISGEPGHPGAKSKLKYNMEGKEIEMIETIMVRNLPKEFSGTYEAKGIFTIVRNYFKPCEQGKTIYIAENEYEFKGLMKIVSLFIPGAFRKQSLKMMNHFKLFAENKSIAL
jgi:hypothetical protein